MSPLRLELPFGGFMYLISDATAPGENMASFKTFFEMNLDYAFEGPAGVRGFPSGGSIVVFKVALLLFGYGLKFYIL